MTITRAQAEDMSDAHSHGLHDELPREGCPDCDGRELVSYPPFAKGEQVLIRYSAKEYGATVEACKRDRVGWDVLVIPTDSQDWVGTEPRWVGAGQLTPVDPPSRGR